MRAKINFQILFGAAAALGLVWGVPGAKAQIWQKIQQHAQKAQEVEKKLRPMTAEEEKEVGREVAVKVIAFYHLYKNAGLTRYVTLVGSTVAAQAERKEISYHFAILDSNDINAFSAPGGYVFVTRGAVALCGDESELAGVLAHEVGHVDGKHVAHIIERDKALRVGMDEAQAHTPGGAYLQKMSAAVLTKVIDQGLAPGDEYDADARGVRYAHASGYPADGLERFLVKLDNATNQGAKSFWTRTHPPVKDRNDRIQAQITSQHWEDQGRPKLADRFTAATQVLKTKPGL